MVFLTRSSHFRKAWCAFGVCSLGRAKGRLLLVAAFAGLQWDGRCWLDGKLLRFT
jgi:hypothetical protein